MQLHLSRRALARVVSFSAVILVIPLGVALRQRAAAEDYRRQLETTYVRALGDLSSYLANLSVDLEKGEFVGTPASLSRLSARIWKESGGAKSALAALPASELHLEATYKFLSQVGDYAMALSKKVAAGGQLTDQEVKNAAALREYAGKLRDQADQLRQQVSDRQLDVTALRSGEAPEPAALAGSFENLEQTMTGYPTLIYDGPFSDHLLTQKPQLTRGHPAVTAEEARAKAAAAARMRAAELSRGEDENSNMPSYGFYAENLSIGVTKAGGHVTYLLNAREIGEERLRQDIIFTRARQYLEDMGYPPMHATYYETADGICTINYAATDGDVLLYTDLVKVGVALDDGSIVFYDARGYINNHRGRELPEPALTADQAARSLSPHLLVMSSRLALIPTSGKNEVLTYEFLTRANDGQQILVYVNAATGAEEEILLLIQTPNGTLTK